MITFSKLGKKGNIGNQLFQIASTIGIAKANNHNFAFPSWKFASYFENELPILKEQSFIHFQEKQYHFGSIDFDDKNYDLEGWFQSEHYFGDSATIKEYFKFKEKLVLQIKQQYQLLFQKKVILISIRRGDFVNHKDYFQLPIHFYLTALAINFPDFKSHNILILSDDLNYCKFHFSSLDNAFFAENATSVEQLILASLCDDFIISNSTFSWWCAWLGEKQKSKIIRPIHNFSEIKRNTDNDKDYFPERWIIHDSSKIKLDFSNIMVVLQKKNSLLEQYINQSFIFYNTDFTINPMSANETMPIIVINDCFPSPIVLLQCESFSKNTLFYNFGKTLKISAILDKSTFIKQFDFGIFARLISNKRQKNTKVAVGYFVNKNDLNFKKIKVTNSSGFDLKYCYSGRVISFLEFKFFLITTSEKWYKNLKKLIKKSINYTNK